MLRYERDNTQLTQTLRRVGQGPNFSNDRFLQFSRAIQSKTFLPINKYNKVPFSKTIVRI